MSIKKLDALRDQIADLQVQRDDVEAAPLTRDEASARFDHILARIQDDPITGNGPAGLAGGSFNEDELLRWLAAPGFLCETFATEIKAGLLRRFDAEVGDAKSGIAAAERRARLADLDAEIFRFEQVEEELIEALEAAGGDIARRPDADARAALGLGIEARKSAA